MTRLLASPQSSWLDNGCQTIRLLFYKGAWLKVGAGLMVSQLYMWGQDFKRLCEYCQESCSYREVSWCEAGGIRRNEGLRLPWAGFWNWLVSPNEPFEIDMMALPSASLVHSSHEPTFWSLLRAQLSACICLTFLLLAMTRPLRKEQRCHRRDHLSCTIFGQGP